MNKLTQFAPTTTISPFGGRKVIDVDTHYSEPHDLWTKRAPARLKDRVPRVSTSNGQRQMDHRWNV